MPGRPCRRRRRPIGYKLGTILLLLLVSTAAYAGYSEMEFRKLREVLASDIATYERQRWDRPVLRGVALEGNAAQELLDLVAGLPPLTAEQRDALAEHLYYVKPLDESLKPLISERRVTLAKLRAATRNPFTMTVLDLSRGAQQRVPDYERVIDASLMLLATGLSYDAHGCLELGADVIRMGQDLVPGAPLEAASVAARVASIAQPLMSACAARADEGTLRRAASELHSLATHAAPTGVGVELLDIIARVELLERGALLEGEASPLHQLGQRPALFDKWAYFDNPTRWREITPRQYPAALDKLKRELDYRSRSEYPEVAAASAGTLGWLYDDMRGQALVRAMAVGVATLAERARRGRWPREPISLRDPALRDPFTGQPLRFRFSQDGAELVLWSLGEDLRDDKASSDWGAQAPVDVVARFAPQAPPAEEPPKAKRRRRRR